MENLQNQFLLETDALSVLDKLGKTILEQLNCLGSLDHSTIRLVSCAFLTDLMWPD